MVPYFLVNSLKSDVFLEGGGISKCFRNMDKETGQWNESKEKGFEWAPLPGVRIHAEQTLYLEGKDPESETDRQQASVGFVNTESICELIMYDMKINILREMQWRSRLFNGQCDLGGH